MNKFDVLVLTCEAYTGLSEPISDYMKNVLLEDALLCNAITTAGMSVHKTHWDDPSVDFNDYKKVVVRTTWDYHKKIEEWKNWLETRKSENNMINPVETIIWNMDKHYLKDLEAVGIPVPKLELLPKNDSYDLAKIGASHGWKEVVIKPTIAATGRSTFRVHGDDLVAFQSQFDVLIKNEDYIIQEFMEDILVYGEVSIVTVGGQITHAVRKVGKEGEFKIQDSFGGRVLDHQASEEEIVFSKMVMEKCPYPFHYGRIDIMRDNQGQLCLGEIELIEPELWFRLYPDAARKMAGVLM